MRVVGWNVRSLRDGRAAVVAVVRSLDPDVLVLQEAPRLVLWRLSRWWLAQACGLQVVTPWRAAGNVVLVRPGMPLLGRAQVRVPKRRGLHRRAAVVVRLEGLAVAGTHLDLREDARLDTAARVRAALPEGPAVLSADVNDVPGSATWAVLAAGLVDPGAALDVPTFPARAPSRRIDALLARDLHVLRFHVADVPAPAQSSATASAASARASACASDHRALVLDLRDPSEELAPDT
jgi:endonuclease/exonuclease/phosphatase family metal-dependent hydrolase